MGLYYAVNQKRNHKRYGYESDEMHSALTALLYNLSYKKLLKEFNLKYCYKKPGNREKRLAKEDVNHETKHL